MSGARSLQSSIRPPQEDQEEIAVEVETIKNVTIATEGVISRENANPEKDQGQDQEMIVIAGIEEGVDLREEETGLLEEVDPQDLPQEDTVTTQEITIEEEIVAEIEIGPDLEIMIKINPEIMIGETEGGQDQDLYPDLQLHQKENADQELVTKAKAQKRKLRIIQEGRTVDAKNLLLLIEMIRTAPSTKIKTNHRILKKRRVKPKAMVNYWTTIQRLNPCMRGNQKI